MLGALKILPAEIGGFHRLPRRRAWGIQPAAALILCADPRIIDGDSFVCDGNVRIRLWGVDSAERHEPAGPAATRALSKLITGKTLTCQPKGRSYNRIVAQCWIGNRDIASEMVRQGQAVDLPKFSKGYYRKDERR